MMISSCLFVLLVSCLFLTSSSSFVSSACYLQKNVCRGSCVSPTLGIDSQCVKSASGDCVCAAQCEFDFAFGMCRGPCGGDPKTSLCTGRQQGACVCEARGKDAKTKKGEPIPANELDVMVQMTRAKQDEREMMRKKAQDKFDKTMRTKEQEYRDNIAKGEGKDAAKEVEVVVNEETPWDTADAAPKQQEDGKKDEL